MALNVARDPDAFQVVLRYLTYGKLTAPLRDPELRGMVIADAAFYRLPGLAKEAGARGEEGVRTITSGGQLSNGFQKVMFWGSDGRQYSSRVHH